MGVIDQHAWFMGVRAAETFFELFQLHLQPLELLEQISLPGLFDPFLLALLAPGEQLTAPSRSCRFHWLTSIG